MRFKLNGYVSADEDLEIYEWFGFPAFSPSVVRQALEDNPAGEELVLEINSYGGSVWAGSEIYSVLRSSSVRTRAEIQSLAASAASYLALGCDSVWISPVAQFMAHMPSTVTDGDRNEHKQSIKVLDSIAESILNAYEAKSNGKRSRDELSRMMQATSWLTAQEALDAGLVDGILYQDESGTYAPGDIVNAVGGGIRALAGSCGAPDLAQLRTEYYKSHNPAGGAPANHKLDWQTQARLDIEKNRFLRR